MIIAITNTSKLASDGATPPAGVVVGKETNPKKVNPHAKGCSSPWNICCIRYIYEMKRTIFLVTISFISITCFAQTSHADSLKNLLKDELVPVKKFDLINKILEDEVNSGVNIDTALCIEMLRLAHDVKNDSLVAISYNMAGSYNARKGDYTTALEYLLKAVPLAEKVKDQRRICSLYFDISLLYIILKNGHEAFYYNLKGGENLPGKTAPLYDFLAAQFNRNMVRYYLLVNKPDSALPYVMQLQQEGVKLKTPVIRLPSLFLSGAAYSQLGKKDSAEFYFSSAAGFADSISSIGLKWTNDKYYILYLIQNGRIKEAKQRAYTLLKLGEEYHNWDVRLTAVDFLRTVFNKTHEQDSAYYFSMAEMSMKDSFFNENNSNKVQVLAFNDKLRSIEERRQAEIKEKQRQQNIVLGMIFLGIITLVILFVYLLRKRRTEMHKKLAGQRERISKELHDNVGSQLTYIRGNIDWLIDSKDFLSREEEMKKLAVVSETSKTIMNDLRETIWVIKKENIRLDELSDRLKSYLQKQVSFYPGVEIEIIEDIRKNYDFPPTELLNMYRICQEAITNIIKHAHASKIMLEIRSDKERNYFFAISDNGRGFETPPQADGHYGLLNMMQRAGESGTKLSIHSEPGKGTKLTLVKFSRLLR